MTSGHDSWHAPDREGRGQAAAVAVTAAIGLALGYSVVGMATFGLFVVPLSKRFGWGRGDIAVAYTVMCYSLAVVSPIAGALIDRYGVRRVLLPSIALFALVYAGLALQDGVLMHYYVAYALLAVLGVGTAPPSYARIIVPWFDRRRGLALGLGLAGVGIGTTIMPMYMQYWIDRCGYKGGYVATALISLAISWPLAWLYLREPDAVRGHPSHTRHTKMLAGLSVSECLRQRAFWQMAVGFACLGIFTSGLISQLVPLLIDRAIAPSVAARALSLLGATLIVGRVVTGLLLDLFFAPYVVTVSVLASVVGVGLLWAGSKSWDAFLAIALVGFTVGAELDFMSYLVSRYQGLRAYGKIYGLLYGVFIFGSGIGPLIMGYGHQVTGSYTFGLGTLLAVVVAAIPTFVTLGRYPAFGNAAPDVR